MAQPFALYFLYRKVDRKADTARRSAGPESLCGRESSENGAAGVDAGLRHRASGDRKRTSSPAVLYEGVLPAFRRLVLTPFFLMVESSAL